MWSSLVYRATMCFGLIEINATLITSSYHLALFCLWPIDMQFLNQEFMKLIINLRVVCQ